MKPLYLFDLDGTLADLTHRLHHITGDKKDWNAFFEACIGDAPILEMIKLACDLKDAGGDIWIVSGRSDKVMEQTAYWLLSFGVPHDALIMRENGDYRSDCVVKQEMLNNMLVADRERIVMAFDDRDRVVEMWRANGIRCLQVAPGDF